MLIKKGNFRKPGASIRDGNVVYRDVLKDVVYKSAVKVLFYKDIKTTWV